MKTFRHEQGARPVIAGLGVLLGFFAILAGFEARAQTNLAPESRYLLIFDTSAAMKRRSENVQRVAGELIASGMNGQMHGGDTIGVWTFDETLQTGKLPLMRWTSERRTALASRVAEFVRTQKFERVSSLVSVMPVIQRVVTNSAKLTVLIFSDGASPPTGTPFDAAIAAAYVPFRETQKTERMPFVTVLRAKAGEYLGYSVTPSPWAVEFPKFPPDPVVVVAPKVEPKPPPKPAVPPLIVIGQKDTNTTPAVELPQPGTEPKTESKPGMTEAEKLFAKLAAEQGIELPPGFASNSAAKTTIAQSAQPTPAPVEQSKPQPTPAPPKPTPPPAETKVSAQTVPAPATAPVPTNTPAVESKSAATTHAVVVPVEKSSTRLLLIAGGTSVLVVALGMVYALMRRRQRSHISLITSSMDRRNK